MLTREELHLLLNAKMRRRNALAIRILLSTGVRGAELYTAKWDDVHLDETRWHIPASKTGPAMDVPLAPVLVQWFKELRVVSFVKACATPALGRRAARCSVRGRYPTTLNNLWLRPRWRRHRPRLDARTEEAATSWWRRFRPRIC